MSNGMDKENNILLLDAYFAEELTPEEKKAVESQIMEDDEFYSEFNQMELLYAMAKRERRISELKGFECDFTAAPNKDIRRSTGRLPWAIAATIALLVVLLLVMLKSTGELESKSIVNTNDSFKIKPGFEVPIPNDDQDIAITPPQSPKEPREDKENFDQPDIDLHKNYSHQEYLPFQPEKMRFVNYNHNWAVELGNKLEWEKSIDGVGLESWVKDVNRENDMLRSISDEEQDRIIKAHFIPNLQVQMAKDERKATDTIGLIILQDELLKSPRYLLDSVLILFIPNDPAKVNLSTIHLFERSNQDAGQFLLLFDGQEYPIHSKEKSVRLHNSSLLDDKVEQ